MRFQIAACLLCLMIVGGVLDRLPDPPAVKPPGCHKELFLRVDCHAPALEAAKNHTLDGLACAPGFQPSLFSLGQILESRGLSWKLDVVRQATDASPPCFS